MSKKQQTLFQSWGSGAKSSQPKSSQIKKHENDIITLDSDEDDELLREALDISLRNYHNSVDLGETSKQVSQSGGTSAACLPSTSATIEALPGFDNEAGKTWIYPTNYPVRKYQRDIVETCLFQNTLVALPTGLGNIDPKPHLN